MDDKNDVNEILEGIRLSADEKAEQMERYIEQMKEEIKMLKRLNKQKEKLEKLEHEKKKIISSNLKSHKRHR